MVCYQVLGNDYATAEAAKSGQMELNVMTPLIGFDLLWSIKLMTNMLQMLDDLCVKDLKVGVERSQQLLEKGLSLVTVLNPYIGYEVAAEAVKAALKEDKSLVQVITEKGIMAAKDLEKVLDAKAMTEPALVDKELQKKIQNSVSFKRFKQSLQPLK
jgi:aspartate ammonia-lyase